MLRLPVVALGLLTLLACTNDDDAVSSAKSGTVAVGESTTSSAQETSAVPPTSGVATTGAPSPTTAGSATTAGSSPSPTSPPAGVTTTAPGPSAEFSLAYPAGWSAAGQMQATAFASGATCGSALIVDRALPDGSGPGAQVEQSYVQVCWKGLEGKALADFMAATYGSVGGFQATVLAGRPAFVSRSGTSSTYFVDTSARRYQVVTAVTASSELRPTRLAQVEQIVGSLTLPT